MNTYSISAHGGCGRAQKYLLFASCVLFSKLCWAFPLFLSPPADAGDVFRGGHSQEVLFHYPRCCAFWAERGCSPHWDVPGPPAVPELKGPMFATTTNSPFIFQVCGGDSFFYFITIILFLFQFTVEQPLSFPIKSRKKRKKKKKPCFKSLVINSFISVCCIVNREGCSFCLLNCCHFNSDCTFSAYHFFPFCIVSAFYTKINVVIKRLHDSVLSG